MVCNKCGNEISEGVAVCGSCGQPVDATPVGENTQEPVNAAPVSVGNNTTSFSEAIKLVFKNYANFTGRSTKSEFWWGFLFLWIVNLAASFIPVIGTLISLALFIPNLSLCIRRLHDIGKAWTWILLGLIPLAGVIILIVLYCKDSDGDNQWGAAR